MIVILLLVFLFLSIYTNKKSHNISIPKDAIVNINDQKELKPIHKLPIISEQIEIKPNKPLFYSVDPFINHSIIMALHYDCIQLFKRDKKNRIEEQNKQKQPKIKTRIIERFKECQKINNLHPEFYLDNEEKVYKQQSGSGSLLEKGLNYKIEFGDDYEIDRQFIKELSQTDPRVLLSPKAYYTMSSFHLMNSFAIVMNLTHSQNLPYTGLLLNTGQIIYNCNRNNGCGKNSIIMYNLCTKNKDYCDLENYNEYIKFSMTQGQQADLTIVVNYIETLFEGQ